MTEREQKIREVVSRLSQAGSNVSPEFTLLSLADAQFLLEELSFLRDSLEYVRSTREEEPVTPVFLVSKKDAFS